MATYLESIKSVLRSYKRFGFKAARFEIKNHIDWEVNRVVWKFEDVFTNLLGAWYLQKRLEWAELHTPCPYYHCLFIHAKHDYLDYQGKIELHNSDLPWELEDALNDRFETPSDLLVGLLEAHWSCGPVLSRITKQNIRHLLVNYEAELDEDWSLIDTFWIIAGDQILEQLYNFEFVDQIVELYFGYERDN